MAILTQIRIEVSSYQNIHSTCMICFRRHWILTRCSMNLCLVGAVFIGDTFRNLVPFAQFKKCEKLPWTSVTFSKATGFTNGTK